MPHGLNPAMVPGAMTPGANEIHDECGVFGIFGHEEAAVLTFYGLQALQHRGQEAAGITVSAEGRLEGHKGMGLVSDVFGSRELSALTGDRAIGHVRYTTAGDSSLVNAQPLHFRFRQGSLALAHNGNLVNARRLREELEGAGSIFQTTSDTEVVAHLMARSSERSMDGAFSAALQEVRGGFAFLLLTSDRLLAARDPSGIRPLVLGRLGGAWVLASETCAFDTVGAKFVREVEPGEMITISESGLESQCFAPPKADSLCSFEFVYFARPDSNLLGANVHLARKQAGRFLAQDFPVEADVVIGVPDSSISAASGYAEEAGIPYEMGLIKNRYVGRTFIQPTPAARSLGVKLKLNAVEQVVGGKRVVLVDDSIVRGTTSRHLIRLVRDAGAREVHLRISSPPYVNPCHYGIDTADRSQLLASRAPDIEAMRQEIGADSLAFLSLERLAQAIGRPLERLCTACFSGRYPVPLLVSTEESSVEQPDSPGEPHEVQGGGAAS